MHPVLPDPKRLALYLAAWMLLATLLAMFSIGPASFANALLLTLPPTLVYAFVCLAAQYPARAMPLRTSRAEAFLATHLLAAMMLSAIWFAMFHAWSSWLGMSAVVDQRARMLAVVGVLLYLLSVSFHYVLIALEREMAVQVLTREAELKALKAQLDPHFLFNSLNSISSLCGSNPSSARTLTTLLAEYLRKSLRVGSSQTISLSEELELASSYLAIERIRFGPRLEFEQHIDESVRSLRVPPLLLQPLVENAVTHGIGQLLEGGVVRIDAHREGERVRIAIENRCDPDRAPRRGEGIGLANARRRVETYYGAAARFEVTEEPARFRVALSLPA